MGTIKRQTYMNTTSEAGLPVLVNLDVAQIIAVKKWYDTCGNPRSVYHMDNGDTHLYLEYGEMNGMMETNVGLDIVTRKKDLFNRFA